MNSIIESMNGLRIALIPTIRNDGPWWRAKVFAEFDDGNAYNELVLEGWPGGLSIEDAVNAAVAEYERDTEAAEEESFFGRPPDLSEPSVVGKAWKTTPAKDWQHKHIKSAWLIHSTYFEEDAEWYLVAVSEIVPGTLRSRPGVTHDIVISIVKGSEPLSKGLPPKIDLSDAEIATPPAVMYQFSGASQDELEELTKATVEKILFGYLRPTAKNRNKWTEFFWTRLGSRNKNDHQLQS